MKPNNPDNQITLIVLIHTRDLASIYDLDNLRFGYNLGVFLDLPCTVFLAK